MKKIILNLFFSFRFFLPETSFLPKGNRIYSPNARIRSAIEFNNQFGMLLNQITEFSDLLIGVVTKPWFKRVTHFNLVRLEPRLTQ